MLETLHIQNFALIDEIEVDFRAGLNVLSGETGAGKSILVGALNLVLGARASGDFLRKGAKQARIEALFRLENPAPPLQALLDEHDIELEEHTLLLSRTLSADGRSRAYVGGALKPLAVLSALGDELVDLHGQHEHQSLLKTSRQLALLDAFGGLEKDAAKVGEQVRIFRDRLREAHALEEDDRDRQRRLEFLRFEVEEIAAAALVPGEEEARKNRLKLINNSEQAVQLTQKVTASLMESENAALDSLGAAERDLEALAEIDVRLQPLSDQFTEARNAIQNIAADVRSHADDLEFNPDEQEELNQRQTMLGTLKRKYGASVEEILAYRQEAAGQLEAMENRDARLETLRQEADKANAAAKKAAIKLSKARKSAANSLNKAVTQVLRALEMKAARFEVALEESELNATGLDQVEFLLSANAGEELKALRQVASGGEVSRIMLALKAVFAGADRIPTLIFDEIDAGVGGSTARSVGEKLAELGLSHQVLCISHLAQIAAHAQNHFIVNKQSKKGHTRTEVNEVRDKARVEEVARLLDGNISPVGIQHAESLLRETKAQRTRPGK
jgi:DNA repair protein RecN (Recombination protein N)